MAFIEMIGSWGWWMSGYLVPFIAVLAVIIFIHELGHFLVARLCGVEATAFSLGFGPELVGFNDRHGTRWKLCAIPLGGYVKFLGDGDPASAGTAGGAPADIAPERTFHGASVLRRIAIVAAGPAANFLLAITVFAVGLMVTGRTVIVPRIDAVQPGSPAQAAGFRSGDVVIAVDGSPVESFDDFQRAVAASFGAPLTVTVARGTEHLDLTTKPEMREVDDGLGGKAKQAILGVRRSSATGDISVVRVGPGEALAQSVAKTWYIVAQTGRFVANIVVHRRGADQLGGPIRIAELSGKVAAIGIGPLIELMAILSVSVGLINLLPIPVLDGGHLLFFGIELARGTPVPAAIQRWGMLTGVSAVLALMVFTTFNDVLRLLHS